MVTGGASGIGAAVVERLLRRGLAVSILDLSTKEVEPREHVRAADVDVTDEDAVGQAVDAFERAAGPVTLLVTSHGIRGGYAPALDLPVATVRRVLDVHVMGTFIVATRVARSIQRAKTGGAMVFVSSTTAFGGWTRQSDYGVAKAAVRHLGQTLAVEWAPLGIRVNTVAPGFTATAMVKSLLADGYDMSPSIARTPLGRLAEPDEQAAEIEHLLLDAPFTTGVCLPVDGGWTAVGR
ncbi:MAG: SDR family oxidoreductase [Dactylosporangium sp.]|nr:SDR family oxidoreductase [Dactylosporangium sp.]